MDNNQENETSTLEQKKNQMNRTQNTFLSTGSSHKFRVNSKFRLSSSNNLNKYLPPINTSTSGYEYNSTNNKNSNICYPLKSDLIKKNNDSENLMQRLTDNRMDMNKKNNELTQLKIKYCKLLEENRCTKNLIANILGVEVDKAFTKKEILDKMEKSNPTKEEKKKLKYAYDTIQLKMEINDKKNKISEINKQIEYYLKNAKSKTLTDLEKEYASKNKHQEKIKTLIEKLNIIVKDNNKILNELKKQYSQKKIINKKVKEEFLEIDKKLKKSEDDKDKLDNLVNELREKQRKIQDRIKVNKYKSENEESISFKKIDLENIENYIKKRDIIFKDIETRKNNLKALEKEKLDLDKIIHQLSIKNNDLSIKMDNYNKEGPKLMQKSYEPLNNQRNMKDLEEKLKIFRNEYEMAQKSHEERQNELKEELDKLNEEIEENSKVINANNDEKNKLNGEIDELNNKIEKLNEEISEKKKKIDETKNNIENFLKNEEQNKKDEEEKEKLNEEENKNKEEESKKEEIKKDKEHKKELNLIKKEIDTYKNENNIIQEENERLKKEIEEFVETINQCENIEEKIKEAMEQLEQLKS